MTSQFDTPILVIIFNRPELNDGLISILRKIQPKHLYIAADGPRANVEDDIDNCAEARQIANLVDWECDVKTAFQDTNLGCGLGVSSAISWFFETVKEGIIIEDDIKPEECFFYYCKELLSYYRDDQRIMAISGSNFGQSVLLEDDSYLFSHIPHVWGWATWRRAWKFYNYKLPYWDKIRETDWLERLLCDEKIAKRLKGGLDAVFFNNLDTWDYQWVFACLCRNGLTVIPKSNLVSNIGFNESATHTNKFDKQYANLSTFKIDIPLNHPECIKIASDKERKLNVMQKGIKKFFRIYS